MFWKSKATKRRVRVALFQHLRPWRQAPTSFDDILPTVISRNLVALGFLPTDTVTHTERERRRQTVTWWYDLILDRLGIERGTQQLNYKFLISSIYQCVYRIQVKFKLYHVIVYFKEGRVDPFHVALLISFEHHRLGTAASSGRGQQQLVVSGVNAFYQQ